MCSIIAFLGVSG